MSKGKGTPIDDGMRWIVPAHQLPSMSLRDYFAGQALAGFRAREVMLTSHSIAKIAFQDADAMLSERDK